MQTALNYLDHEQAQYRELNARLATAPLPHLEIAARRAQRDRRDRIPHIDAEARLRAARNEIVAGLDRLFADVSVAVGAIAGIVALGAAAQVVALFVGGVL